MNNMINPSTGEIIDETNIDSVIGLLEAIKIKIAQDREIQNRAEAILFKMAKFDNGLSCRVRGLTKRCKIALSNYNWDQSILKHLWNEYDDLVEDVIDINTFRVNLKEYAKIVNEFSNENHFMEFKEKLQKANLGRTGKPLIIIEENIGE